MPRDIADITADLDALTGHDFDYSNSGARGWDRLDELCDELQEVNDSSLCVPIIFKTMERLDGIELGNPGPLVHTLETLRGRYEPQLMESIRRKPTPLAVWMVNRILNAHPPDAASWLSLLRDVINNPTASEETKAEAADFITYQTGA